MTMDKRGCTPVEIPSLLEFRDCDLIVRCLELVRTRVGDFAPECRFWEIQVIALCHHHPDDVHPALGIYEAANASLYEMEEFGCRADEWVREQTLGWLLEACAKLDAPKWQVLVGDGRRR